MPLTGPDMLRYEKQDGIVIITLNRPERMNALSSELRSRVADALDRFREDDEARVAIVCGNGKAFCAGRDLKDSAAAHGSYGSWVQRWRPSHLDIPKPTICAIQGYAIAAGFRLAKLFDIRIATEEAEFGISEGKLNLPASFICDLTRQLRLAHALELALWGDKRITAQRAYEMGWVNRVVPKEKLMDEAMDWAERMLYLGPRAVMNFKKILYQGFYIPPEQMFEWGSALEVGMFDSEDAKEGARAFAEKRKPRFTGK